MKICPQCKTTYTDKTLNFCLEDGSALLDANVAEPPPTVVIPDARETFRTQQDGPLDAGTDVRTIPRLDVPPPKKSRTWLWVLGILMGVGLLCGGGFVGLVVIGSFAGESNSEKPRLASRKTSSSDRNNGDPSRRLVYKENFSGWKVDTDFISSERRNNSMVLTSVEDYFYVILTKDKKTYDSSTLLTVRNVSGDKSSGGYGLVIHSSPGAVLENDYAFLIRSDDRTFRVVRHLKKKERNVVDWTRSEAIKSGTSGNDLEVRAKDKDMELFINGEFVKRFEVDSNYKDGVAGVYTSDAIPIAFSKLEIRR